MINNNIILQVDVEITDTPNTDSVLIINNDGDQKIYNSVDILIYNCKTEQEWQILTDVNSKCKLIQCKPNNNSLCKSSNFIRTRGQLMICSCNTFQSFPLNILYPNF